MPNREPHVVIVGPIELDGGEIIVHDHHLPLPVDHNFDSVRPSAGLEYRAPVPADRTHEQLCNLQRTDALANPRVLV